MPHEGKHELARALRDHTDRAMGRKAVNVVMGTVTRVSTTKGMAVQALDHGFTIEADDLTVTQAVAQYDVDYGIKVGDSVALAPLADGSYAALGVMSGSDATARRWDGLLIYGSSAPSGSDGRNLDFYIQTDADPNNWKIYGPKASGSWPTGIPIRGPAGANGTNGNSFRIVAGTPSNAVGQDGDTAYDPATGLIYTPKAAGVWPAGVQMVSTKVIGELSDWPGPARSIPAKYLACFGQSVLRATYPALFAALCPSAGAATVTIASPGVFTLATHGLVIGDPVFVTTAGALPTGLVANTTYYVMTVPTASTFTLGTTRTISAITGAVTVLTAVNTSGTQSGVHTLFQCPHGVADATHFNIPDMRGMARIGKDDMGGSDAGLIPWANVTGLRAGESLHTLLTAELASHRHAIHGNFGSGGLNSLTFAGGTFNAADPSYEEFAGGDTPHNVMQPGVTVHTIIYCGV